MVKAAQKIIERPHWRHKIATNYFRMAKEHNVQWQLNRSYSVTCILGRVAAQFNWPGNCATATVDTVVLGKCQAACISKITVELTTFLPCSLMSEMEYNGECFGCFTASDIKHSHSIPLTNSQVIVWNIMQHWNLVEQVNQKKFSRANSERGGQSFDPRS